MNDRELERLLRDPRAHGEPVDADQVAAWGDQVVGHWRLRRNLVNLLYRCSLVIGVALLLQRMWERSDLEVTQLKALPSTLTETFADGSLAALDYPYLIAALGIASAVLLTRPLRERLLAELG